jgi:hypothetical protein
MKLKSVFKTTVFGVLALFGLTLSSCKSHDRDKDKQEDNANAINIMESQKGNFNYESEVCMPDAFINIENENDFATVPAAAAPTYDEQMALINDIKDKTNALIGKIDVVDTLIATFTPDATSSVCIMGSMDNWHALHMYAGVCKSGAKKTVDRANNNICTAENIVHHVSGRIIRTWKHIMSDSTVRSSKKRGDACLRSALYLRDEFGKKALSYAERNIINALKEVSMAEYEVYQALVNIQESMKMEMK